MIHTFRAVAVALVIFGVGAIVAVPATAAPSHQAESADGFSRLLGFVPAPATLQQLAGVSIHYADPGAVKRLHGYSYTHAGELPELVRDEATDLSPEQLRSRRWWWDLRNMELPKGSGSAYPKEWRDAYGYDVYGVTRTISVGEPPNEYGVVELDADTSVLGQKLLGLGYEQEPAPHGYGGILYRKFADGALSIDDRISQMAFGGMNRVVVGPGLLVTGRSTASVSDALAAHTDAVPSAITVPAIAQVIGAVEDPNLLPGTSLISSSLVGIGRAPIGGMPATVLRPGQSPQEAAQAAQEAMQAADALPLLPPYLLFALTYFRGADQSERFQTITLLYPDEAIAHAAGTALTARFAAYRSTMDGKPILGEDVIEQLEPVVRSGEGGATVTARLRLSPDHRNLFLQRLYNRDLEFLAPGGSQ
jgi:hypothetical protein